MNRILKWVLLLLTSIICLAVIILFELKKWIIGGSVAGAALGIVGPYFISCCAELTDDTNWKVSQRKYQRGGFISKNSLIRISFAYLFRIKIGDRYFLIKNARGTNKFQPVGGVYKMQSDEKIFLKNNFSAVDDDKIPIDDSSKDDYRLMVPNKYLRKFIIRFDETDRRETLNNLSREFKEELIDSGIIPANRLDKLSYRYCGRHFESLKFSDHFQCYELLMADILEVTLTEDQEKIFKELSKRENSQYCFASSDMIKSLGIIKGSKKLSETIADHTLKILQENEQSLLKEKAGSMYDVSLQ